VDTPKGEILYFSKMESARRQLVTAIWLWFKGADIVSVHSVTGAAFGILHDLSQHRKKGRPIPFDETYMPKGYEKDIRDLLKSDEVFFKHARKDPDAIHELHTVWTETYVLSTCRAYAQLMEADERLHPLVSLFVFWSWLKHPELFENAPPFQVKSLDVEKVKKLERVEFFEELGGPFFPEPPLSAIAERLHTDLRSRTGL
jgi:hypothetical protein